MLEAFDFVQQENSSVPGGQFPDRPDQSDAIDRAGKPVVPTPIFTANQSGIPVIRLIQRNLVHGFLAEMHQNRIDRDAMEPGGECRVTSKRDQLAEHLQKRILSKILGFRDVVGHAQADGINPRLVRVKNGGKRIGIALLSAPH